jgi:hypothetical protein
LIYEFIGQYKIENGAMYLYNKDTTHKYKIEGDDINILIDTLPYFTGTFTLEEICKRSNRDRENLKEVIKLLKELNLLKIHKENKPKLFIMNDGHSQSVLLQNLIIKRNKLSCCNIQVGKIEQYLENMYTQPPSLILSISFLYNKKFIKAVEKISIENKISFLNVSLFGNINFVGPLLSFEDGPCSECLDKSSILKNDKYQEVLGDSYMGLSEMIINEVIRFLRYKTYVNSFNRIIKIDFSDLNIEKFKVYKLPNCSRCQYKQGMLQ